MKVAAAYLVGFVALQEPSVKGFNAPFSARRTVNSNYQLSKSGQIASQAQQQRQQDAGVTALFG